MNSRNRRAALSMLVVVLGCWLLQQPGRASESSTALQALNVSADTGEKPQSKVWFHGGTWWAVLPSASPSGTWVWRLNANNSWSNVLQLSTRTDVKADVKDTGAVTHVLLYAATSPGATELASIEYVASQNSYQLWSGRTLHTPISLPASSETATIDVDSTGRLWLATKSLTSVVVYHSDTPYTVVNGPDTLETGINSDDIALVTALPNSTVGVLWSNQTTQRFGFRVHVDGADPATWSADEVPASQSAQNVGLGMADDHMNVAVAADGTLYAAVKTSYDTAGATKIALLVRRPNGAWDNLYHVDVNGTRPVVLLDELRGLVRVIYTSTESGGNILYKESSTDALSFAAAPQTLIAGSWNNATTTKQNWTGRAVVLASNATTAQGVLISREDPALVGWWPLNQSSGAVASDYSGFNHQGVFEGTPTWVAGVEGNALSFDGPATIRDAVSVAQSGALDLTNGMTLSAWIKPGRAATQDLITKADGTTGYALSLSSPTAAAAQKVFVRLNGVDTYRANSTTTYPAGGSQWIHAAATFDGTVVRLYINGVEESSVAGPAGGITANSLPLMLGGHQTDGSRAFQGQLDDVRIYNRALSAAEIGALADVVLESDVAISKSNGQSTVSAGQPVSYTVVVSNNGPAAATGATVTDSLPASLTGATWTCAASAGSSCTAASGSGNINQAVNVGVNGTVTFSLNATVSAGATGTLSNTASVGLPSGISDPVTVNNSATDVDSILPASGGGDPVLVGAGDIANDCTIGESTANSESTARLLDVIPGPVFTIGDNAYTDGTATQFATCYDPTWGRHKARTRPTTGNHEYNPNPAKGTGNNATPYFDYFNGVSVFSGPAGDRDKGYYSYNVGTGAATWHVVVLNSECGSSGLWSVNGCAVGSPQEVWLRADLAASPTNNIIAMFHKARYSSGATDDTHAFLQPLWQALYDHGVDLALAGHWHNYERLSPVNASGQPDTTYGIRQLVVGTGGRTLSGFSAPRSNSEVRNSSTYGVLKLTLHASSYDWEFIPIQGQTFTDSGTAAVHGAPAVPTVTGVSPSTGSAAGGTGVTVTGTGFSTAPGATTISFGAVSAANVSCASTTTCTATSPAGTSTVDVLVTVGGSTSSPTAASRFSYLAGFNTGLVGYWRMDEGSGTTLVDASGSANHATLAGSASWPPGLVGLALSLSGATGQYATAPHSASLNITGPITLATWVKPGKNGTQNLLKKATGSATAGGGYELSLSSATPGKVFARFGDGTTLYRVDSTTTYPSDGNTWVHVATTYDGSRIRLYVNGALEADIAGPTSILSRPDLPLAIGADPDAAVGNRLQGQLDEARIYNRALSAAELQLLMSNTAPVVSAGANQTISTLTAALAGSVSDDGQPNPPAAVTMQWSKVSGPGTVTFSNGTASSTGVTFSTTGVYVLRLSASDGMLTASGDVTVTVSASGFTGGLVGYWTMDESTGATTIADASGQGNTGALVGAAQFAGGKVGRALNLAGGTGGPYASVPDAPSLNPSAAITVALWMNPGHVGVTTADLVTKTVTASTGYQVFLASTGKVSARLNNAFRVDSATSYPLNSLAWMHVALTYDGATVRLYINGVKEAELAGPTSIATSTTALGIGAQSDGTRNYKGLLDDVRIYSRALGAAEITTLSSNTPPVVSAGANQSIPAGTAAALVGTVTDDGQPNPPAAVTTTWSKVSGPGSVTFDNAAAASTSATFSAPGLYVLRLSGSDGMLTVTSDVTVTVNDSAITPGLVGRWKMDEGSGGTLIDSSPSANNAAITGSPTWTGGIAGSALSLSGTGQYAIAPHNSSLTVGNVVTVSVWIKPAFAAATTADIVTKACSTATTFVPCTAAAPGYELFLGSAAARPVSMRFNNTDVLRVDSVTPYPLNSTSWMHVAAVYDGGTTIRMYINGRLDATKTVTPFTVTSNTVPLGIGAQADGTRVYKGLLDDVRIYNRALTADELKSLGAHHLTLNPSSNSVTLGTSQAYIAEAFDVNNSSLGDLTSWSAFGIAPDGSCTAAICTPAASGVHTVTATSGVATGTATLTAGFGALDHMTLSPASATIAAGGSQVYTATGYDASNNNLGDVTGATTFAITPNGSCTSATCSAATPGAHTVTATNGSVTATAALQVDAGALDHLVLSPATASIVSGATQSYTAQAQDSAGNNLGDVTASTIFTISPDGSCSGASCTASISGAHTVTGTKDGRTGTATLTISGNVTSVAATLVQTINTSAFNPASPDPSGITYIPGRDRLLIVDSEVEETTGAGYQGVNIWELTRAGVATSTGTTLAFNAEPTGASYDPAAKRLFISSDEPTGANAIYVLQPGADDRFGTPDDIVRVINTAALGATDTEDPEFDPASGHLFFLNGIAQRVFRIDPVNAVFGDGDDLVTYFDIGQFGAVDVEALAVDQARDTLLIGDRTQKKLYEVTKTGQLVRIINLAGITGLRFTSGLSMAPASDGSGRWNYWIVDRGVDNDTDATENDGKIFEVSVASVGNTPPVVDTVTISPSAPKTGDVVAAIVTGHDGDGQALTYEYQWFRNGVAINETGATLDLALAGHGDRGDAISVRAIAFDGTAWSTPRTSATIKIANTSPVFDQDLQDRTDAEQQPVSLSASASDADSDTRTYTAAGLPPGLQINAQTGLISGTIAAGAAAAGPYSVTITVRDGPAFVAPQIAQVQKKSANAASGTSVTMTYDTVPTSGNLLIAIGRFGQNRIPTMPSGWQLAIQTNTSPRAVVFFKVAGPSESASVTLSASDAASTMSLSLFEYSGLRPVQADVLDSAVASSVASANVLATGVATTTESDELLIAALHLGGVRAFADTWTGGFMRQTSDNQQSVAHRTASAPGEFQTQESWTGTATSAVTTLVTFKAAEPAGATTETAVDTFTWTVTRTNRAPVVTNPGAQSSAEGASPSVQILATDADGNTLTYSATGLPTGLAIDSSTGLISGTVAFGAAASNSVVVTVSDGTASDTASFTWTVTRTNRTPVVTNPGAQSSAEGASPSLQILATDADGNTLTYSATGLPTGLAIDSSTGLISGTVAFGAAASNSVVVTVSDGTASDTASFTWTVTRTNRAPLANAQSVTTLEETAATITLTGSDADGDPLTFRIVAGPTHGTLSGIAPDVTYTPAANYSGADSFTFRVNDGAADSALATVSITVTPTPDAPTVTSPGNQTSAEGAVVNLQIQASDADAQALAYTATGLPEGLAISSTTGLISGTIAFTAAVSSPYTVNVTVTDTTGASANAGFSWTVTNTNQAPVATSAIVSTPKNQPLQGTLVATDADGDPLRYALVTQGRKGTASIDPQTGSFVYSPVGSPSGTDTFTFKANDGTVDSNVATITVKFLAATPNRAPVASDGTLSIVEDATGTGNLVASDPDGTAVTYRIATNGAKGTATVNPSTGAFTYVPLANANGTDAFTFMANDGTTSSNTATVTVTIAPVNDAPVATSDTATTVINTPLTIAVLANDSDVDDTTLMIASITVGNKGTVVINEAGTHIVYTPNVGATGQDTFTYVAKDAAGVLSNQATVTVTIMAGNTAPTAQPQSVTTAEDTSRAIILTGTDPDGQPLTFTVLTGPTHGTLSGTGPNVTYSPAPNYSGSDSFSFKVNDGVVDSPPALVTIAVTAVNDAPVARDVMVSTTKGTSVVGALLASDVDGDSLTFTFSQPKKGTVTVDSTGSFTYTPYPNAKGTDTFVYRASDGLTVSNTAKVTVTIR